MKEHIKKLFDIPVYALSPDELCGRVQKKIDALTEYAASSDDETKRVIVDRITFPQRCWDYNHIIGYIRIGIIGRDVVFDLFCPYPSIERYIWYSPKKAFLFDVNANGTHFYTGNMKTNDEIQSAADEMLTGIIKDFFPKRYFVDRSCFDNLNQHLDYLSIVE